MTICFVRSAPSRLAGRPARIVATAYVCDTASAPIPSRRCVPHCPMPRRDQSRRDHRVRPEPSWLPGLSQSSSATHPSRPTRAFVAPGRRFGGCIGPGPARRVPPPAAARAVLGWVVRAHLSTPQVSTPSSHLLGVSAPVSTPASAARPAVDPPDSTTRGPPPRARGCAIRVSSADCRPRDMRSTPAHSSAAGGSDSGHCRK